MKKLAVCNNKGGVGKSLISVQLAYFFSIMLGKRVGFADLDPQCNSTKALLGSSYALERRGSLFDRAVTLMDGDSDKIHVFAGYKALQYMERSVDLHDSYVENFIRNLADLESQFDVFIVDIAPTADVRYVSALAGADYVIAPIQFNQEAVDGVGDLIKNIVEIQQHNTGLEFLGMLPNLCQSNSSFQLANQKAIEEQCGDFLLQFANGETCCISNRSSFAEAQAVPCPIWKIKKSAAKVAAKQFISVASRVAELMEVA